MTHEFRPPAAGREAALRVASRSLSELLDRDPSARAVLESDSLPSAPEYAAVMLEAGEGGPAAIRLEKRRRLLQVAALDLAGEVSLEVVGRALSSLADAVLVTTLRLVGAPESLAVIAMGKLGARELNYVSDIDVMFVSSGDLGEATRAAEALMKILNEPAAQGVAYSIDANLRPEGRAGPLVRSLDGYLEYYKRWAETWEFQALLKARPAAGDLHFGECFVEETRAFVFPEQIGAERIASIRKMKERVEEHVLKRARRSRLGEAGDVKLGPGGIRDIEFSVQLLQLVHGSSDPSVRAPATLEALRALVDGGYVAEDDAAGLSVAYRWLRNVEHRLQLRAERRVRLLPRDAAARSDLAHAMGFKDSPKQGAVERFDSAHQAVLADVRSRFDKLFYRPMIETLADSGGRLSGDALRDRLRILGFRDVERAERTLTGLVSGTTRRAKLFRVLTPAVLRWLAATPLPDEGLFSFLRLGESLGQRADLLGQMRDNPPGLEFLATVLGSGRLLGELLTQVPEELHSIADPRGPERPKARDRLVREGHASLQWRGPEQQLDGLRRFKRRELLRIALSDLAGRVDVTEVGRGLSALADACLEAALGQPSFPFAVIGLGKLGGEELSYSSDIDVMFVHEGDPALAERVAEGLMQSIGRITPEGQAFRIDAGLRPEGKSGPLARTLDAHLEYYSRWARPWEFLALTKARPAAGDPVLAGKLIEATRSRVFRDHISSAELGEIRHLKARMERERIPRGVAPRRHLKLGPGGTADIEFSVQMLQLRRGHEVEGLRVSPTLDALAVSRRAGLVDEQQAVWLEDGYRFLMRLRNRLFLMAGRATDVMPDTPEGLEALGVAMGYESQPRQELEEHYLRVTRRARRVAETLIYG